LNAAHEKLTKASHKLAEVLYKVNSGQAGAPGAPEAQADGTPVGEQKKDEGVIDAEYVDVEDKSKHLRCGSPAVPAEDRGGRRFVAHRKKLFRLPKQADANVMKRTFLSNYR